jgi:hypothetical protein
LGNGCNVTANEVFTIDKKWRVYNPTPLPPQSVVLFGMEHANTNWTLQLVHAKNKDNIRFELQQEASTLLIPFEAKPVRDENGGKYWEL